MKKTTFSKENFSFICPMQWDDMQASKNGRFCGKCQQEVIEVTDCSVEEVTNMQKKDPHLCVAIKTLVTASMALTMTACTQQSVVSGVPAVNNNPPHKQNNTRFIAGGIAPPAPRGQTPDFRYPGYTNPQQTIKTEEQQDKKKHSANKTQCDLPKNNNK